jgi:putative hydrolase of the HAD superfamily
MHKAVIFDLGKVLVPFDFQLGYRALEKLCAHEVPEIRRRIAGSGLVGPFEKGLMPAAEFVDRLSAALGCALDYDIFCRAWSCIFTEQLLPDAMLESLASRYRLLLLSNTNAIHFKMIREKYPLIQHFHELILSYEVHAAKPEPAIFKAAIERAGCRPEECFYTDDIAEFVEAGRNLGMDAVQFRSAEQLEDELAARGIQWT